MEKKPYCCFCEEDTPHHLDHYAPLCWALDIEIWTTSIKIKDLITTWYPGVGVRLFAEETKRFAAAAAEISCIFVSVKQTAAHLRFIFSEVYNKKIRTIFIPHGFSEKGLQTPSFHPFIGQECVAIYGQIMDAFLQTAKIAPHCGQKLLIGNIRQQYAAFSRHQQQQMLQKRYPQLTTIKQIKTLYCPTWNDYEEVSSFERSLEILRKTDMPVCLKLHPILMKQKPAHTALIEAIIETSSTIINLSDVPVIFPIFEHVGALITDGSSIAYDFLPYNKLIITISNRCAPLLHRFAQQSCSLENALALVRAAKKPPAVFDTAALFHPIEKQQLAATINMFVTTGEVGALPWEEALEHSLQDE